MSDVSKRKLPLSRAELVSSDGCDYKGKGKTAAKQQLEHRSEKMRVKQSCRQETIYSLCWSRGRECLQMSIKDKDVWG